MMEPDKTSYRPIKVVGSLLILQVVTGLAASAPASVYWEEDVSIYFDQIDRGQPPESQLEALALQVARLLAGVRIINYAFFWRLVALVVLAEGISNLRELSNAFSLLRARLCFG